MLFLSEKKDTFISATIFACAFAIRLVYLYESSDNPTFDTPIVDARYYDMLARSLVDSRSMDSRFFWQPFFYPVYLSIVYVFSGSSMSVAKVFQLLMGSFTCVLTHQLGQRLFDRPTGVLAAAMVAFYGPLIFYEAEILAVGWAGFWSVVLTLLFLEVHRKRSLRLSFDLGVCGVLSVLTRPSFLPFFSAGCAWLIISLHRAHVSRRLLAGIIALLLTGFLLLSIPVALQNYQVTGHFGILPASGGLNLYIGNNPNSRETISIRPGLEWHRLIRLPARHGVKGLWNRQQFFFQKVLEFVRAEPISFTKGLCYKAVLFVNSREIPRNTDIYLFHKWSVLLPVLVWKAGPIGFPFGVLFPLAVLGLILHWRRLPPPVILFLIFYPFSIILVFVTSRYRVPVVPLMAIMAAAGLRSYLLAVGRRNWRLVGTGAACIAGALVLTCLPIRLCQSDTSFEAELYYSLGYAKHLSCQYDEAIVYYRTACKIAPNDASIHNNLASALYELRRFEDAIDHYSIALRISADNAEVHNNLGMALTKKGNVGEAKLHYLEALRYEPTLSDAHNNLGLILVKEGELSDAIDHFMQALRIEPDFLEAQNNLSAALSVHLGLGRPVLRHIPGKSSETDVAGE